MTHTIMRLIGIGVLAAGLAACQAVGVSIGAGTGGLGVGVHGSTDIDAVSINGSFADGGSHEIAQRD